MLSRSEIEEIRQRLGLTYGQVWIDYQDLGGSATAATLANYLRTGEGLNADERARVAEALDLRLDSEGVAPAS